MALEQQVLQLREQVRIVTDELHASAPLSRLLMAQPRLPPLPPPAAPLPPPQQQQPQQHIQPSLWASGAMPATGYAAHAGAGSLPPAPPSSIVAPAFAGPPSRFASDAVAAGSQQLHVQHGNVAPAYGVPHAPAGSFAFGDWAPSMPAQAAQPPQHSSSSASVQPSQIVR